MFTGGRRVRLSKIRANIASPRDFLYGYDYFLSRPGRVDYLELDNLAPQQWRPLYWVLRRESLKIGKSLGIGSRSHYFVGTLRYLNQYDCIVATTDSIALGLAHYKIKGQLKGRIIYLNMGLAAALDSAAIESTRVDERVIIDVKRKIKVCDKVISLGRGEYDFFQNIFPDNKEKFLYLPFGVDSDFWTPGTEDYWSRKSRYILFVGNDKQRDFDLLLQVADRCPNQRFIVVSNKLRVGELPKNVQLIQGDYKKQTLTDSELREFYRGAKVVMLPLRDTLQPSGQSVALQAMSCGVPVVLSKTRGLWDPAVMRDQQNCILMTVGAVKEATSLVKQLDDNVSALKEIGKSGRQTVVDNYSAGAFARKLAAVIEQRHL